MKKITKKILSLITAAALLFTAMPENAFAMSYDGMKNAPTDSLQINLKSVKEENKNQPLYAVEIGKSIRFEHKDADCIKAGSDSIMTIAKNGNTVTVTGNDYGQKIFYRKKDIATRIVVVPAGVTVDDILKGNYDPEHPEDTKSEENQPAVEETEKKPETKNEKSGIVFCYIPKIDDSYKLPYENGVKFTIDLIDEQGNNTTKKPEGFNVPNTISFDANTVSMIPENFPEITIPGYVPSKEFAYFFWEGNNKGTKYAAYSFTNFGRNPGYGTSNYIGYTSAHGNGDGVFGQNTYWYQNTGTLHIVYYKVLPNAPKTNYFVSEGIILFEEDTVEWNTAASRYDYYPINKTVEYSKAYMEAKYPENGEFLGWYQDKACTKAADKAFFDKRVTADITVYAKWNINKNKITVSADSAKRAYDGTALTAGYTVTGSLVNGDEVKATVKGSQTDAGSSENVIESYKVMRGTEDVTKYYEVTTNKGTLEVTKLNVTLKSLDAEKVYDGTALTKNEVKAEGFINGQGASYQVTGSILAAGTAKNTFTYTLNANTKAGNYNISKTEGILKVTPITAPITITAKSASKKYDGAALTEAGYTYTQNILKNGDVLTAVVNGTITDAGKADNVVKSYKVMHGTTDVTESYTFATPVNGSLEITKRNVTLTSGTASKTYDGSALKNETMTVGGDKFVGSEGAVFTYTGSQTEVGTSENTFEYQLKANTKAKNYNITKQNGSLTVSKKGEVVVTITGKSGNFTYDGTEHTVSGYSVSISDPLYREADFRFTGNASVTRTNAGSSAMGLKAENFKNINKNFKDDVTFIIVDGYVNVAPIATELLITANSGEKTYDGSALEAEGFKNTENILVNSDVLVVEVEGSITNAGTAASKVKSYKVMRGTEDVTANYTGIKLQNGTLKINKKKVTLTSASAEKTYDGTPLQNNNVNAVGFVKGEGATYTVSGSQLDAGSSMNNFSYSLNANTKAANYDITPVFGTLKVNKISTPITITAGSASQKYNGDELSSDEFIFTEGILVEGDELKVETEGKIKNAGKADNKVKSFKVLRNGKDVTNNYTFAEKHNNGKLEISRRNVQIKSVDSYTVYGEDPGNTNIVDESGDGFIEGEGLNYSFTAAPQIEAGQSTNSFEYAAKEGTNLDNYVITKSEGILNVSPSQDQIIVTIYGKKTTKVYNGEEQQVTGYTFKSSNSAYDASKFTYSGSQIAKGTDVGTYAMNIDITKFENIANNFKNVVFVSGNDGQLTITPYEETITVKTGSASKEYDGKPLTVSTSEADMPLFGTDEIKVTCTGSQTNAGSSQNTATIKVYRDGKDITENYKNLVVVPGTLTVEKKDVTITSGSFTKFYDGKELRYEVANAEGLAAGESIEFENFASIQNAGTAENKFDFVAGENTNLENYAITPVYGTLTVNKRKVVLTSATDSMVYDGTPLTNDKVTASEFNQETGEGFVPGEGFTAKVTGSVTFPGTTTANNFEYTLNDGTLEENYEINKIEGQITVMSMREAGQMSFAVIVKAASGRFTFDGGPHTVKGFADAYKAELPFAEGEGQKKNDYDVKYISSDENTVTVEIKGRQYIISGLTASETAVEAGTYSVNVEGTATVITMDGSKAVDVTENFIVIGEAGELVIDPLYHLTIHYQDENGTQIAADYNDDLAKGTVFRIDSPVIEGMTPNFLFIQSGDDGMVAQDVEVFVIYHVEKEEEPVLPGESGDEDETEAETEESSETKEEESHRGGEIVVDEETGVAVIEEVEETKIPLAPGLPTGHKCCVLHFLILLAAFILMWVYVATRKKHQKKIHELKKELFEAQNANVAEDAPADNEEN